MCMYFQQYVTILIAVALYLVFKSVSVNPSTFFSFMKNCLGYSTTFAFLYKFYNQFYQFPRKILLEFWMLLY